MPDVPGSPQGAGAAGTWSEALDQFAAILDRFERRLADDAWDDPTTEGGLKAPGDPPWPRVPLGTPTAADRGRCQALLARAAAQAERLAAERDDTAAALTDLSRRRTAARRYQS